MYNPPIKKVHKVNLDRMELLVYERKGNINISCELFKIVKQ